MNEVVKYWLESAEDDYITAQALFDAKRYLWMGFLCHLTIEKGFKACIAKQDIIPPKIHNLGKLAHLSGLYDYLDETKLTLMANLDTMQIEARYPEYKKSIESGMTLSTS
ncbi:MAG: HEPN domain-containing protein [Armatimonadota bacterium]